ncbi:MAG: hypothetical protein ACRDWA_08235 [Acidimicrobiia bacterium]
MSIGNREWKIWRKGEPFAQRFSATVSEDGNTIAGRWEKAEDGTSYTTDSLWSNDRLLLSLAVISAVSFVAMWGVGCCRMVILGAG